MVTETYKMIDELRERLCRKLKVEGQSFSTATVSAAAFFVLVLFVFFWAYAIDTWKGWSAVIVLALLGTVLCLAIVSAFLFVVIEEAKKLDMRLYQAALIGSKSDFVTEDFLDELEIELNQLSSKKIKRTVGSILTLSAFLLTLAGAVVSFLFYHKAVLSFPWNSVTMPYFEVFGLFALACFIAWVFILAANKKLVNVGKNKKFVKDMLYFKSSPELEAIIKEKNTDRWQQKIIKLKKKYEKSHKHGKEGEKILKHIVICNEQIEKMNQEWDEKLLIIADKL